MTAGLVLAGGGKMGGAMLAGWLERGVGADQITVVEPAEELARDIALRHGVNVVAAPAAIAGDAAPAVVVFAVKPQVMDDVVPAYARFAGPGTMFLSIAAGRTIAYFENILGPGARIVRAMPNTPAAIGRGITVAVGGRDLSDAQVSEASELLQAVGEVAWVEDESLIDPVTALSGGGPAYVFLLVECLARAGVSQGLPEALARRLARATVAGSGELLHRSGEDPETLRKNVTSPGGTTAEALQVLMAEDGLQALLDRAIAQATRRSRELAG